MQERNIFLERTYTLWGAVLIVWALYRFYFQLPEWVDELIVKPLLFLLPAVLYVFYKEKRPLKSIGLTKGKFKRDVIIGLGLGLIFAIEGILANSVKYGRISLVTDAQVTGGVFVLMLATALVGAFCEETLVRGFIFTRLKEGYKNIGKALVISASMYFMLLVPIIFTLTKLNGVALLIFILTNIIMSLANTMIFNETRTVTIPTLIHAFWNLAVAVYL